VDFAAGELSVDPKAYPSTCAYCQQRLLCRLNPEALAAARLEDEDVGETPDV
jgi:hypothetical protein